MCIFQLAKYCKIGDGIKRTFLWCRMKKFLIKLKIREIGFVLYLRVVLY